MRRALIVLTFGLLAVSCGSAQKKPETVPVIETSAQVPEACLKALDDADYSFDRVVDVLTIVQDVFGAIPSLDSARVEADATRINEQNALVTPRITAYQAEAAACRAAG